MLTNEQYKDVQIMQGAGFKMVVTMDSTHTMGATMKYSAVLFQVMNSLKDSMMPMIILLSKARKMGTIIMQLKMLILLYQHHLKHYLLILVIRILFLV